MSVHGDTLAGWAGSWLIYGGSAHLATLRTLDSSGLVLAIVTGILINARLVVYSASLAQQWKGQPIWFRLVAAPLVIDPTWALAQARAGRAESPVAQRRFFVGAGPTLGIGWSTLIAVGVVVGDRLDAGHLAVAVPLCLASLVAPHVLEADTRWVCAAAAAATLCTVGFPAGTGVLVAIVAGIVAGGATWRRG